MEENINCSTPSDVVFVFEQTFINQFPSRIFQDNILYLVKDGKRIKHLGVLALVFHLYDSDGAQTHPKCPGQVR